MPAFKKFNKDKRPKRNTQSLLFKRKRYCRFTVAGVEEIDYKDVDTLLDLMKQAQVNIPLKAVVTPANRSWVFGDLLAHLQEEHTAFTAAKENQTR